MKTYNFKKVVVIVGGSIITGFADSSSISAEFDEDRFTPDTGADGEYTRSQTNNNQGTITLNLKASSLGNAVLNAFYLLDKVAGSGIFPLLIKDLNGTTLIAAPECYVLKPPAAEFESELGEREWTLATGDLSLSHGGIV